MTTDNDQSTRAGDGMPAGFVLVPTKLTRAMGEALLDCLGPGYVEFACLKDAWAAVLAAAPALTPEMIGAGIVALHKASGGDFEATGTEVRAVWDSMLAAAPAAPLQAGSYLSWSGFNVHGDEASIKAVRDALHEAGTVPELKQRIRDDAQRLAAPAAAPAWQPIETAPKDGSPIWVIDMNALDPQAGPAFWRNSDWHAGNEYDWQDEEAPEKWGYWPSPTHWHPLPAPPEIPCAATADGIKS